MQKNDNFQKNSEIGSEVRKPIYVGPIPENQHLITRESAPVQTQSQPVEMHQKCLAGSDYNFGMINPNIASKLTKNLPEKNENNNDFGQ